METPNNSKPPTSPVEFRDLTEALVALQLGLKYDTVPGSVLGFLLKSQNRKPFSDGEKLKSYLRRAQTHGIVTLCKVKGKETTISLAPARKVVEAGPNKVKENGTSEKSKPNEVKRKGNPVSLSSPSKVVKSDLDKGKKSRVSGKPKGDLSALPLIKVLMHLHRSTGASSFRISGVGSRLYQETKLLYGGTLRQYLNNAKKAGVVKLKGEGNNTMISLDPTLTPSDKPSTTRTSSASPPSNVRAYATLALPSLAVSCLARRAPMIRTLAIHPRMVRYHALK